MTKKCPAPEVHALGEVVAAFGTLEFQLEAALWQLLGNEGEAHVIAQAMTAQMSFKGLVNALDGMFGLKYADVPQDDLRGLVKELFSAEQERNALVHSAWLYERGPGTLLRFKAVSSDKGRTRMFHHMTTARMEEIRDKILATQNKVALFVIKYLQGGDGTPPQVEGEPSPDGMHQSTILLGKV